MYCCSFPVDVQLCSCCSSHSHLCISCCNCPDAGTQCAEEWADAMAEKKAKYQEIITTGKVDRLMMDIKDIFDQAEEATEDTRQPKVIVYSNFDQAFARLKTALSTEDIAHTCATAQLLLCALG